MATPQKSRVERFKEYVAALNKQFTDWCTTQVTTHPDKFLSNGITDYLRHSAKLRREFGDIIQEHDTGATSPGGAPQELPKYTPLISLMPISNTKTIHFIRHGEGFHNLGYGNNPDAHLTEKGWEQAHALGRHMAAHAITRKVEVVIVSPMMRTLETAAGVFNVVNFRPSSSGLSSSASLTNLSSLANTNGANTNNNSSNGNGGNGILNGGKLVGGGVKVLMLGQAEEQLVRAQQDGIQTRGSLQFIAHELCRERLGPSVCDMRQPLSNVAPHFPSVDFSLIESNEDPHWKHGQVEGERNVVARGQKFLQYLMSRPESNIAVVTHSAFLWFTLATYGNEYAKPVRENLQRWYENCEMRSVVLSDGGGMGVQDKYWFKGGHAFNEPQQKLMEREHSMNLVDEWLEG